jgi:hypothetical protein
MLAAVVVAPMFREQQGVLAALAAAARVEIRVVQTLRLVQPTEAAAVAALVLAQH